MPPMFDAGLRVAASLRSASLRALLIAVVMLSASLPARAGSVPMTPSVVPSLVAPVTIVDVESAERRINTEVMDLAFSAASCAVRAGAVQAPTSITVIDYSKPSTEKRLWVVDLRTKAVLYEELVAHGMGTGDNMATSFSNAPDSHKTSLGLFVTEGTYVGKNGYSLRLDGLDQGFNDRARERAIVMHGAPYVSAAFAQAQGRLGRSWGCPALREDVARQLIDKVKGGNLVFAYYPDAQWLKTSQYLGDCAAAAS
jgi:hypothetical protein